MDIGILKLHAAPHYKESVNVRSKSANPNHSMHTSPAHHLSANW